jgi:hypothetical protein
VPHNLKHFDITVTTSAEQNINNTNETIEDYFRKNLDKPGKKFSTESFQMAIDQFFQLNFEESIFSIDHYKVSIISVSEN